MRGRARVRSHAYRFTGASCALGAQRLHATQAAKPWRAVSSAEFASSQISTRDDCPLAASDIAIVRELATGNSYRNVAAAVGLTGQGLRARLSAIYGKLNARDRAHAVRQCLARDWI
jgi:DNA-binding NarL/FixJ family response regulator